MKILLLISGLTCCLFSLKGQNLHALDDKNGFRDLKFGMSIKQCGFILHSGWNATVPHLKNGQPEIFEKADDLLKIGGFNVKHITYSFYEDKLYQIEIMITDSSDAKGIFSILNDLYGKCEVNKETVTVIKKEKREIVSYVWNGNIVKLEFFPLDGSTLVYVWITNKSIDNIVKEKFREKEEREKEIERKTKF